MGGFDFWSDEWLDLHVIDPTIGEERLNILLGPDKESEKKQAVADFLASL
ncbi:hypothetical protein Hsw_PA0070 (plasmid) [Hymenobacter swuensis DY53]|uniref:Uncharacterized protein n=2 Tax=Hymenobacter TaxID=89966 RepID=W8ES58_9BACT|nr:hypothetical protein Hsw_PA0070 [Hymenobacter swuensis DY53]